MMITINIHMPSLFIGGLIGYLVIATVFLLVGFDDRWHTAFSQGWESGKKFAEGEMREEGEQNEQTD